MKVRVVSWTADPQALLQYAGKVCSRGRAGGSPAKFVQARIKEGHESIIEHACITFEISGVSRVCSHSLVRHRIASFSQESQRYVAMPEPEFILPPSIKASNRAHAEWDSLMWIAELAYKQLCRLGIPEEDARFALPHAIATRLVMTMNFRSLRNFFSLRCDKAAQWEIRAVATDMLRQAHGIAPAVFADLHEQFLIGEEDK